MRIDTLPLGPLETNCYVVANEGGEAYLIDPGDEPEQVIELLTEASLTPRAILLTHAHFDHIGAVPELAARYHLPVVMHPDEVELYHSPRNAMPPWFPAIEGPLPEAVHTAPPVEGLAYRELRTPGHTRGGVSFYFEAEGVVFTGDALFRESIGRTDLPGGDWETLMDSIKRVLFSLPGETTVYPGHYGPTTIAHEQRHNPYLQG